MGRRDNLNLYKINDGPSMEVLFVLIGLGVVIGTIAFAKHSGSSVNPSPPQKQNKTVASHPYRPQKAVPTVDVVGPCHVVDGDTISIDGHNIRLAGIDAPEMDHPYGKNAKWNLINLTKGQKIKAVFHGEQTHAREVATCFLPDGRDLSAEMVAAGLAIDWPKFSGGKYRHLEPPDARKRMWRADARQKGKWPPNA